MDAPLKDLVALGQRQQKQQHKRYHVLAYRLSTKANLAITMLVTMTDCLNLLECHWVHVCACICVLPGARVISTVAHVFLDFVFNS
jgi:hypothetical protein